MKVKVYYNLHKKCLSVADSKGKVIEHTDSIFLKDAKFRVQPAGRKRVLKEKRKNVHAYVSGERSRMKKGLKFKKTLTYDPYKYDSFVDAKSKQRMTEAENVYITGKKVIILE
jgi:hypothetical protein